MEKVKKKKKGTNFFKSYFSDFGFRQLATIIMFIGAVLSLIGILIPHQTTLLIGMYFYAAAGLLGVIVYLPFKHNKKSPAFRRSLLNMIVMFIIFGLALTAIIILHVNGIYKI